MVTSSSPPLLDLTNDFTSPFCMYGITISGMASSFRMLTPISRSTFGWSSRTANTHSLRNSSALKDDVSWKKMISPYI